MLVLVESVFHYLRGFFSNQFLGFPLYIGQFQYFKAVFVVTFECVVYISSEDNTVVPKALFLLLTNPCNITVVK